MTTKIDEIRSRLKTARKKALLTAGISVAILTGCGRNNGHPLSEIESNPQYDKIELMDLEEKAARGEHMTETEMKTYVMKSFNEKHINIGSETVDGHRGVPTYFLSKDSKAVLPHMDGSAVVYTKNHLSQIQYTYFTTKGPVTESLAGDFTQEALYGNKRRVSQWTGVAEDICIFSGKTSDGKQIRIEQHFDPKTGHQLETSKTITDSDGLKQSERTYSIENANKGDVQKRISQEDGVLIQGFDKKHCVHRKVEEFDANGNIIQTSDYFYRKMGELVVCDRVETQRGQEKWTTSFQYHHIGGHGGSRWAPGAPDGCHLLSVTWSSGNNPSVNCKVVTKREEENFQGSSYDHYFDITSAEDYAYVSYNEAKGKDIKQIREIIGEKYITHKVTPKSTECIGLLKAYKNALKRADKAMHKQQRLHGRDGR